MPPKDKKRTSTMIRNTGVVFILLSGVCFFTMLSVPLMPFETSRKAIFAGGLFVAMQIFWWTGAALAGPSVVTAIKSKFLRKS